MMKMSEIGYIGIFDEHDIFLYQCPKCRTVKMASEAPCCDNCTGINRNNGRS
ncbi:MAG: hypothetical protein JXA98_07010 [Methanosarcinaceae archaeon]|nr:hypothetical protein [Methanosarcinaceae archaeon]